MGSGPSFLTKGFLTSLVKKITLFDFDGTIAFTGEEFEDNRLINPIENREITSKLKELIESGESVGILTARKNEGLIRKYLYHIGIFAEELEIFTVGDADSEAKGEFILENFTDYDIVVLYDNRSDYLTSAAEILKDSGIGFAPVLVADNREYKTQGSDQPNKAYQRIIDAYIQDVQGVSVEDISSLWYLDPEEGDLWVQIKERFFSLVSSKEREFIEWVSRLPENLKYAVYAVDMEFDGVLEDFIDHYGVSELYELENLVDVDFFQKCLDRRMESYRLFPYFMSHGWLFKDGTSLDASGDDHRLIPMELWFPENIITLHLSGSDLSARLNTTMNQGQVRALNRIIKELGVSTFTYDVYQGNDQVSSGVVDLISERIDWAAILNPVKVSGSETLGLKKATDLVKVLAKTIPVPDEYLNQIFYHGGYYEDSVIQDIFTNGLKGRDVQGRAMLAPLKNFVYMTKDFNYALIYAVGGSILGSGSPMSDSKDKPWGLVFEIPGSSLSNIQPDEDAIGELIWRAYSENNASLEWLKYYAETYLTSNQLKKIKEGEYMYYAQGGKRLTRYLPHSVLERLLQVSFAFSNEGRVAVSGAYVVDRRHPEVLGGDFDSIKQYMVHISGFSEMPQAIVQLEEQAKILEAEKVQAKKVTSSESGSIPSTVSGKDASSQDILDFFCVTSSGIYGLILVAPATVVDWVEGVKDLPFEEGVTWLFKNYPDPELTLEVCNYLRKLYTKIAGINIRSINAVWEESICPRLVKDAGKKFLGSQDNIWDEDGNLIKASSSLSVVTVGDYSGDLRELAHLVKAGDPEGIYLAGELMSEIVSDGSILVPVPSREGYATTTLNLCESIVKHNPSCQVYDVLKGASRESLYELKKQGKTLTEDELGLTLYGDLPEGSPVYLVDNVVATGATGLAAHKVIPNSILVAIADDSGVAKAGTHYTNLFRNVASGEDFNAFLKGFIGPVYRGGSNKDLSQDQSPFYFTPDKESASFYGEVTQYFIKAEKSLTEDYFGAEDNDVPMDADSAFEEGYDCYIAENTNDGYSDLDQVVVPDISQVVDASPITYDDSGEVVPLSRRFNSNSKDVRAKEVTSSENYHFNPDDVLPLLPDFVPEDTRFAPEFVEFSLPGDAEIYGYKLIPIENLVPSEKLSEKDPDKVASIKASIEEGKEMPPLIVEFTPVLDKGKPYQFAIFDGHHRYLAYKDLGVTAIPCAVIVTREDYSFETNIAVEELFRVGDASLEGAEVRASSQVEITPEKLNKINSQEWFTGNRGSDHPLSDFPVYLPSSLTVATLFAEAGKYVMEVDGEVFMNIDEHEAQILTNAIDPVFVPEDIVGWKSNLLDPEIVGEEEAQAVKKALEYFGLVDVTSFRLLLKDESISGVFVARVSLKNVKVVDYYGRVRGSEDTFLGVDARQAKDEGCDGFLGKNIREGGLVFEEDFPIADTLVVFDGSSISSFEKNLIKGYGG